MAPDSIHRLPTGVALSVAVALVLAAAVVSLPGAGFRPVLAETTAVLQTVTAAPSVSSSAATRPMLPPLTSPTWINVTDANLRGRPPAGHEESSAYDPADNVTVLFGGCLAYACPSNETWVFADGRWINMTVRTDAPPARYAASMDYDANMHGVLLFGGFGNSGALGDTWLYSGNRWTNLTWVTAGASPAPRSGAVMAFDPQPEENGSVLFGGLAATSGTMNDTWVWESWSGWALLNTSVAPPPVELAGFAYSPADGYALLYGGIEVCGIFCFGVLNESWELYAGEWWPTYPSGSYPGPRAGQAMGYDPALGDIVLFSGITGSFALVDDTWTYLHGSWTQYYPAVSPPARWTMAFSPDAGPAAPVLFGGTTATVDVNDTWVLESPPSIGIAAAPASVETSVPLTVNVTVSGGSSPYSVVVDFGDGTSGVASGPGPTLTLTHVYTTAGAMILSANLTDAAGVAATATLAPAVTVVAGPAIAIETPVVGEDVGVPVHLGINVLAPGVAPLAVSWSLGDGSTGTGANLTHAYSAAGTYLVSATATDAKGAMSSASAAVTVAPLPTVSAATAPSSATIGDAVLLFANVTGGMAPYAYAWSLGDGNVSGSPDPLHTFGAPGTYTASVWVNDSGGGSTHATVTVTVAAVTLPAEGTPVWYWAALAALIAIAAVGAALLVVTLRKRKPPATP